MVRNLKCSGSAPMQECILSLICITDWSVEMHVLEKVIFEPSKVVFMPLNKLSIKLWLGFPSLTEW